MRKLNWSRVVAYLAVVVFSAGQSLWAADFILRSPQVVNGSKLQGEQVLNGFGCSGKNISPELNWRNPPSGTKSFAVTVYDPDAPTGSGWWHWIVFNIHADVRTLPKGAELGASAIKGAVQSMTDFGRPGYGGPCPPKDGQLHRYIFTVYALDVASISLDASAPAAMVGFYLNKHVIEKAQLTATYLR